MNTHPIRATLAIAAVGATVAMLFMGIDVPDAWWTAFGAIIAFYFATP